MLGKKEGNNISFAKKTQTFGIFCQKRAKTTKGYDVWDEGARDGPGKLEGALCVDSAKLPPMSGGGGSTLFSRVKESAGRRVGKVEWGNEWGLTSESSGCAEPEKTLRRSRCGIVALSSVAKPVYTPGDACCSAAAVRLFRLFSELGELANTLSLDTVAYTCEMV